MTPIQYATKLLTKSGDTWEIPTPLLYGVTDAGEFQLLSSEIPDIYDAIEQVTIPAFMVAFGVITTGWAAPLNPDGKAEGAPSQHPERRRVKLVSVINDNGAGSAMAFQDEPEDVITDEGSATGSLAEAINEAWENKATV
jgi:hypothetical protein